MASGSLTSKRQIAFEEIEHTADLALKIYGQNLEQLLINAARGLNSIMGAGPRIQSKSQEKSISLEAIDAESLLVEWLSELAFWAETEMLVFNNFDIQRVSTTHVSAIIYGNRVARLEKHVKAVTYHNLEIIKTDSGLAATVVFDV